MKYCVVEIFDCDNICASNVSITVFDNKSDSIACLKRIALELDPTLNDEDLKEVEDDLEFINGGSCVFLKVSE